MEVLKSLRRKQLIYLISCLCNLLVSFTLCHFTDNDDIILINRGYEIPCPARKKRTQAVKAVVFLIVYGLCYDGYPSYIGLYPELLRPVIYVDQEQIVKQQILDKIILIEALLVSDQQVLYLKCRDLADRIGILRSALHNYDIFKLKFIKYLKKLMSLYLLAVSGRFRKIRCCRLELRRLLKSRRQYFPLCIHYPQFHLGDVLKTVYRGLQNLVRYHIPSPSGYLFLPIQAYFNTILPKNKG